MVMYSLATINQYLEELEEYSKYLNISVLGDAFFMEKNENNKIRPNKRIFNRKN